MVKETLAWPRRSLTTLGLMPCCSRIVAWVWRWSCRRMRGRSIDLTPAVHADATLTTPEALWAADCLAALDAAAAEGRLTEHQAQVFETRRLRRIALLSRRDPSGVLGPGPEPPVAPPPHPSRRRRGRHPLPRPLRPPPLRARPPQRPARTRPRPLPRTAPATALVRLRPRSAPQSRTRRQSPQRPRRTPAPPAPRQDRTTHPGLVRHRRTSPNAVAARHCSPRPRGLLRRSGRRRPDRDDALRHPGPTSVLHLAAVHNTSSVP